MTAVCVLISTPTGGTWSSAATPGCLGKGREMVPPHFFVSSSGSFQAHSDMIRSDGLKTSPTGSPMKTIIILSI